jgi:ABC-type anion transport system duplicated permease subunit
MYGIGAIEAIILLGVIVFVLFFRLMINKTRYILKKTEKRQEDNTLEKEQKTGKKYKLINVPKKILIVLIMLGIVSPIIQGYIADEASHWGRRSWLFSENILFVLFVLILSTLFFVFVGSIVFNLGVILYVKLNRLYSKSDELLEDIKQRRKQ